MTKAQLSLLLILCAAAATPSARPVGKLVAELERLAVEHEVPAFGFALVEGDATLWAGARGIIDHVSGAEVGPETVFRIGSITKAFTALALLLAADDGAVALETPLAERMDNTLFTNPWAPAHPIRLVHLLEHTTGFADLSMEEMYHNDPTPIALERALRFRAENRRALWRPGLHFSYSNAGAGLAAHVLEQSTGQQFEDFVRERVFAPLKMHSATLLLDARTRALLATGYDSDGVTPIPYWHMLFRAFGAINSTPHDMASFVKVMLGSGEVHGRRLLPAASIARMEQPTTTLAARAGLTFGYGLGLYSWYRRGHLFHGHGGDGDGYLAHFGYNRAADMGYFVVITRFNHPPLEAMRNRIEDFIIAGREPRAVPQVALSPAAVERITGDYERATYRFPPSAAVRVRRLRIAADQGALYSIDADGDKAALIAVGAGLFRRADAGGATIALVTDEQQRLVFQGDGGNYVRRATDSAR